jgi:hypothetical protein
MASYSTITPEQQQLLQTVYEMYQRGDIYEITNDDFKIKQAAQVKCTNPK